MLVSKHFTLQVTVFEFKRTFAIFLSSTVTSERTFDDRGSCCSPYLFVFLQVAEPRKRPVAELAGIRGSGIVAVGIDTDVAVDLGLRREAGRCRGCAGRRRLAAAT